MSKKKIPETFEDAVAVVVRAVQDYVEEYKPVKFQFSVADSHHGYGTTLRNEWGLWHDSILAKHMKKRFGIGHADDMSGLIMTKAESILNGTDFNLDKELERYKNHWKRLGVDPLTQKQLK